MAYTENENLFEPESGDVCFDSKGIIGKFLKGTDQRLALPFVGYSYYKKTRFDYHISKILQQEEIAPKDFYIKEMQEVSNEGGFRQASIQCSGFISKDDAVEFSLSRGSFATIVLREIMKPSQPLSVGFWYFCYFLYNSNVAPPIRMIAPIITICIPYVIQSGFEYMKDDCGPTTEWPCKWKIIPKTITTVPMMITENPFLM